MCGRFAQKSERKIITEEFYIQEFLSDVYISYNIAPGQNAGVVIRGNKYVQFRWGLVPFWAADPKIGYRMINARAETVAQKSSFRKAFVKRRCLIPADGFYEWKKEGKYKTPFFVTHRRGRPMGFAGLWEVWRPKEARDDLFSAELAPPSDQRYGSTLYTFTIITTNAHERMRELHDRMPVVIMPNRRAEWLDPENENIPSLLNLLTPLPDDEMEFYEVSRIVNSPKNNSPECIQPIQG